MANKIDTVQKAIDQFNKKTKEYNLKRKQLQDQIDILTLKLNSLEQPLPKELIKSLVPLIKPHLGVKATVSSIVPGLGTYHLKFTKNKKTVGVLVFKFPNKKEIHIVKDRDSNTIKLESLNSKEMADLALETVKSWYNN